ncbi:lymphocyte cytosolic protein 2 isoform X2 [Stegastes partitus]|uniref:Lymphocyte cytosolic protein 2-like n=1 Tax=Stegastes partitus TaxID=144197 RepID=A0A3B4ZW08_9TELE|nr:PREDICTED: lymphocyte cytosolic protein 2-like isoform X2 [Stegastes partitus]
MNFTQVPAQVEVMGWSPHSLADYLKKLKLSGCDKLVMKYGITGAQFMQMTEYELQVFPSHHVPIIIKIQNEINNGKQKKSKARKSPKQVFVQEEEVWDSDEFDNDSDNEYEGPDQEAGQDNYICAVSELQIAEQQHGHETHEVNRRLPAAAETTKPPRPPRGPNLPDSRRDPVFEQPPAERTSKRPHPQPLKMNHTPQRPPKAPASQSSRPIDRSKKPGKPLPSPREGSAVKIPGSSSGKHHQPRPPKPLDKSNSLSPPRARELIPVPPEPTHAGQRRTSIPETPKKSIQDLDRSWYGGKVTRHQAEVVLRDVNKDGAFVVRDSTKGFVEHPYTLMLLNQGKVYNIKIRNQGNSYCLGNGVNNTKSFPGVKEMITHHTHSPLLLVVAPDQSSEEQVQCCLLHPAGL